MILDSSAIIAILTEEPGCDQLLARLQGAEPVAVGAPTVLETEIVLTQRLPLAAGPIIERFLQELGAEVLPFDASHWKLAAEAFVRFGKGRHPAALNFGDCMAYATARHSGQPLLCVGNDFPKTDLSLA